MGRYINRSRSQSTLTPTSLALAFLDFVAVADSGVIAWWLAGVPVSDSMALSVEFVIAIGAVFATLIFAATGMYRAWRGQTLSTELRGLLFAILLATALLSLMLAPVYEELPSIRSWGPLWIGIATALLITVRVILRALLRRLREAGWNVKRVALVGGGAVADRAIRQLEQNRWAGFQVVGVFADEDERWPAEKERRIVNRPPTLGGYRYVAKYLEKEGVDIDQVWFALPLSEEETIQLVLSDLRLSTIDICFVPDIFGFDLLNHSIAEIAGLPLLNLRVSPLVGPNLILKFIEDYVVSILALVLMSPVMLLIALLIKLESPGPVIYKQKRHGWDGDHFTIYKFRSMCTDQPADGELKQASKNDSRVTRVGYWLRRTSLDELPQFINVLQGRMSVVGPRPHAVEHGVKFMDQVDKYMLRHKVRPGITGLAQVSGFRGETDTVEKLQKRVEYDLEYIENWSLFGDLRIVLLTILHGFMGRNAY